MILHRSKQAGYPVVIFGGEHADVPLNPRAGAAVAELIATGNRSCLIDLGGWMVGERTRFFIDFASVYFRLARGTRHLVVDEVHNFAPQGKILSPEAGEMLHWANRLASEGRGKGITIIAASQRPQKVHKDFLTSCETLIAGRVIHKLDRDAIKDWIDGCADPATGKQVLAELAGMKRPEAWVWSPEIDFGPERVTFPLFRTYDSFKPQEASTGKLKGWAEVDLEAVRATLQSVVAQAEANDPKALRKRIADLERQIATSGSATRADVEEAERRGFEAGRSAGRKNGAQEAFAAANSLVRQHAENLCNALESLRKQDWRSPDERPTAPPPQRQAQQVLTAAKGNGEATGEIGTGGKRRILIALAQNPRGIAQRKLSILTDISPKGGTWRTYMAELRGRGYIDGGKDCLRVTDAGLHALGDYEPLPTGEALIEYWRRRLGDSGKRAIFDVLVGAYPGELPKEKVSERTNIALNGGTWRTYLAELRGLEIIEGRDKLRASEDLFT
jgi:hypothetical protein